MCGCCGRRMLVANPNKRRGTRWETEFANFLNRELELLTPDGEFLDPTSPLNVRRQAQQGIHGVGDLWVVPFVVECKNTALPPGEACGFSARTTAWTCTVLRVAEATGLISLKRS